MVFTNEYDFNNLRIILPVDFERSDKTKRNCSTIISTKRKLKKLEFDKLLTIAINQSLKLFIKYAT